MTTTEALMSGAGTLAETAAGAVTELAEKAKAQAGSVAHEAKDRLADHAPSHRGRLLLVAAALAGVAAAAFRYLRRTSAGRDAEDRVIDLTKDPVVTPESLPT